jgi:hypothetical protein
MAGPGPVHHRYVVVALGLLAGCARVVESPPVNGDGAVPPAAGSPFGGGGGTSGGGGPGGGAVDDGGMAAGGLGGSSGSSGSSGPSADGPNCGLTRFAVQRLPPNVLIILDKSTSMLDFAKGLLGCLFLQCNSKWTDMKNALTATVTATQGTINWGLKLFPTDGSCGVSEGVAAPVAPNNASAVNGVIAANNPSGSTPTRLALEGGGRYLMGLSTPNPRYIVLATDGLPTCSEQGNGADDAATIKAVADIAAAGVPVYVIGVGTQGGGDATLNAMAMSGGKPRAADPAYYPVTTSADLSAALSAIGGQIVTCTLPIQDPPDPTNIAVDADGVRVPRSATDGWDYGADMKSIQLSGTWCANYQNGTIKDVQTIFGCPGVVIP